MLKICIDKIFAVTGDDGSTAPVVGKSIYLPYADTTRKVRGVWQVTGTFGGATVAGKFQESTDDVTFTDIEGAAFVSVDAATPEGGTSIEFNLGTAPLAVNNSSGGNYGKFIAFSYTSSGGGSSDIDIQARLDNVFMPSSDITLKLYA